MIGCLACREYFVGEDCMAVASIMTGLVGYGALMSKGY